jgi:5-methylcytosine-specific restriction endonuclease McrA
VGDIHLRSGGQKLATEKPRASADSKTDLSAAIGVPPAFKLERHAVVEFSTREGLLKKLDHVRSLASHRLPMNASLEQLIDFLADYFTKREDPSVRQKRREERPQNAGHSAVGAEARRPDSSSSSRRVPAGVRDRIFARDGQCTFVGPNGRRCKSTHVLQIDHIKPVARGGPGTIENLRLLCAYHNRLESQRILGRSGPRSMT